MSDYLELEKIAVEIRKGIVTAVHSAKSGHPGGSLSAADLFTWLYYKELYYQRAMWLRDTILHWRIAVSSL